MKFGKFEVTLGINEAIIGAIIGFTILSYFATIPEANDKLVNQCIGALIAWGATSIGKKGDKE